MNQNKQFDNIEPDYQITALTEDIDLARILNENIKEKCDYVFVITNLSYAVFMTKGLANRMRKAKLDDVVVMSDIDEKKNYGFIRIFDGVTQHNRTVGSTIRSIGFTAISSGSVEDYETVKNILENIESIEKFIEEDRQNNAWKMNVIKIIAG